MFNLKNNTMKTLRTLYTALAVLIITSMTAQKANKQVAAQTITKQLSIENSKGTISYTVKAHTKAADFVTMKGL